MRRIMLQCSMTSANTLILCVFRCVMGIGGSQGS